ncbi:MULTISPECIES: hypothetical protein [unclassified Amycolatopsis]|uniref:hypothetical protein n=1 Tax=unclassified Amycolatopsis TaxID=2618356 RepID=UPI0028769DCA|nr:MULTISPECIES: hypothetical protein [unclassified Amycolatopsis]MDS0139943.1 hypothetical protein [Amycolatopsis sp. 505]MDS0148145.1 hypothetical protein [Amycolatopsis sp. CM201R]
MSDSADIDDQNSETSKSETMDPVTSKALIKAAEETASLLSRIFGPAADEIGISLAERIRGQRERKALERQIANLERIGLNADRKTLSAMRRDQIPPRVATKLIEEARFAETPILTEYIGGILASARHLGGNDDSTIEQIDLISRMSSTSLKLHYLIYRELLRVGPRKKVNFFDIDEAIKLRLVLYAEDAIREVVGEDFEKVEYSKIFNEALNTLHRLELVETVISGTVEYLRRNYQGIDSDASILRPTAYGVSLYMTAFGLGDTPTDDYLTIDPARMSIPDIPQVRAALLSDTKNQSDQSSDTQFTQEE